MRRARTVLSLAAGLLVVLSLTGCDTSSLCGSNQILSYVFCRPTSTSAPSAPDYTIPTVPSAPHVAPYATIRISNPTPTIVDRVVVDGDWSDSDGHVTKFEWDLDGDGAYEVRGTPGASQRTDRRSQVFSTFGSHTVRFRVTDNDGLTDVVQETLIVQRRLPTAVLTITPASPTVGQQVTFDASGSTATDTHITGYVWDIDGNVSNGYETRTTDPTVTRTYDTAQTITVGVRVLDDGGGGHYGEARRTLTIAPPARQLSALHVGSASQLFSARLTAREASPGRLTQHGSVQAVHGMLLTGRFNGRLAHATAPGELLLARLLRSGYRARLDGSVDTSTGRRATTMLVRAGSACLRITLAERPGRRPYGTFRVLGGAGAAGRLAAAGSFGFTPGPRTPSTLAGTVRTQLVRARALPKACKSLH